MRRSGMRWMRRSRRMRRSGRMRRNEENPGQTNAHELHRTKIPILDSFAGETDADQLLWTNLILLAMDSG